MLSAYMDETGHSADARQKFVGMAGLIAPAANWVRFEKQWNAALRLPWIDLPYFHMTDFASKKKAYADWSEEKRRKVLGKLITIIEVAHPIPIGSIVPMEYYRTLDTEMQDYFIDPYYLCFQSSIAACTSLLEYAKAPQQERVAFIFSDQVEFRHTALQLYELVVEATGLFASRGTRPVFRDMRELVALQAADIIAYEMYKEFERRTSRPDAAPRFGYTRIMKMLSRHNLNRPFFLFFDKYEFDKHIEIYTQYKRLIAQEKEALGRKLTASEVKQLLGEYNAKQTRS